jgi:23S rRNA pseudouridine1911/1915/1917 synthase
MGDEVTTITVGDQEAGQRLDQFLARVIPDLSRSRLQQLILNEDVLVNDLKAKPSYKIKPGDLIDIEIPPPPPSEFAPEPIPLDIVYEDKDLIVINKPAGLVVHPGAGIRSGTLANALVYHFEQLSGVSGAARPGIVHRLDKDTSGLMVVAKNDAAHEKLAVQLQQRKMEKTYLGLVYGHPWPPQGKIDAPIGRHPTHRTKMAVRPEGKGREALTLYRVVEKFEDAALVEFELKTGRTHQIRVHIAHIGHPIVGDQVYGAGYKTKVKNPDLRRRVEQLGRHFLHAAKLWFKHPRTGRIMEFTSNLPEELKQVLDAFRFQDSATKAPRHEGNLPR